MQARSNRASSSSHSASASPIAAGSRARRPRARARHAAAHRCSSASGASRSRRTAASGRPATTASSAPAARAYPSHQRSGKSASARRDQSTGVGEVAGVDGDPGVDERHDGHQVGIAGRVVAPGDRERPRAPQAVAPVAAQAVHEGGRREGRRHPGHGGRAVAHPVVPQRSCGVRGLVEPSGQGEHPDELRRRQVGMRADRVMPARPLDGGARGRQVARRERGGRRHMVGVGDLGRPDGLMGGQGLHDPHPLARDAVRLPEPSGVDGGDTERVQATSRPARDHRPVAPPARPPSPGSGTAPLRPAPARPRRPRPARPSSGRSGPPPRWPRPAAARAPGGSPLPGSPRCCSGPR